MTTQHTPEILRVADDGSIGSIETVSGKSIGKTFQTRQIKSASDREERIANARRLVACWNACDGLHTESLERNETLGDQIVDALNQRDELMQTLARVEQKVEALILQRNELLAVVKGLLLYFESGNGVPVTQATIRANTPWVLDARAAIAKATGEQA